MASLPVSHILRGSSTEPTTVSTAADSDSDQAKTLLEQLSDPDCVQILQATRERALSAKEISATTGFPLSTSYRKLDLLQDAGLLIERIRVDSDGHHVSEYESQFQYVVVSFGANGELVIQVSNRDEEGGESTPRERVVIHG